MKRESLEKSFRSFALFGSFGFMMAASILVGYFVGSYIDSKLGTGPWFLLVCLLLSVIGAFIEFFKTVGRFTKRSKNAG
ncbi:MAG: AtpZ/AtpI family protein [Proteobacteria bacterium]|nr:AtpZ/AtpI family protein [Pseudomonadota bacterium]